MSEIRRKNRDANLVVIKYLRDHDLTSDAQATSTSGRWRIILAGHYREGVPCFDVLAYRLTDGAVRRWEWWAKGETQQDGNIVYDNAVEYAAKESRAFYEKLVAIMQEKAGPQESEEPKGITIYAPDGTESDYTIN